MSNRKLPDHVVSHHWLKMHLNDSDLVVLDATLKPVGPGPGPDLHENIQIPGSRVFDFDRKICDHNTSLPHMMPTPELFEKEVRRLGVNQDSVIVIYDRVGIYSSPRAWWMFQAMGHDQVAVLDGGLPAWIKAGFSCEERKEPNVAEGNFLAHPRRELFCDANHVERALVESDFAVIDARSAGRFSGQEPEPRAGLRLGHMPNAINLPFGEILVAGHLRSSEELAQIFKSKLSHQKKLIFSCGSGVTACIDALAARLAGYENVSVYDGSWAEWGLPSSRPVIKDE